MALSAYAIKPTIRSTQGKITVAYVNEGVDHFNVHMSSRLAFGRRLSMAHRNRIIHPIYGDFLSMEGLRRYAIQKTPNERLRTAFGAVGVLEGTGPLKQKPKAVEMISRQAAHCLFISNPEFYDEFMQQPQLPLTSYYYFGNTVKDNHKREQALLDELSLIRIGKPLNALSIV